MFNPPTANHRWGSRAEQQGWSGRQARVRLFQNLKTNPFLVPQANGNLCQQKLVMPTDFVGQNGATLDESTHIEVGGCSNTLSVVSKKVKGKTLTLKVYVPSKGKLTASGKGLSKASKSSSFNEALTLTLHAKKSGKFSTKIKLSFVPKKGKHQSKTLKVKFSN
jgi:hypothetical protein